MIIALRVAVLYLFIVIGLRILGKRELSELSALELVTLLLIPEFVQQAFMGEDSSMIAAITGISTLLGIVFVMSALKYLFPSVEKAVDGQAAILVADGKFVVENLHKERVTPEEILTEMHLAGLERLDQVKWSILEADGKIAFIARNENQTDSG